MSDGLPAAARRFQAVLTSKGIDRTVRIMPDTTRTSSEAATALGCDVAQIAKSLIFRGKQSGRAVLVIASGANRVDEKAVNAVIGEKIGKADAGFVRSATGYAIGGVPPFGHDQAPIVVIDQDLMPLSEIWAAGGTPFAVFPISPAELVRATNGQVAAIAARPAEVST